MNPKNSNSNGKMLVKGYNFQLKKLICFVDLIYIQNVIIIIEYYIVYLKCAETVYIKCSHLKW